LQIPERPYPASQPILSSREEYGLATGGLHLGQGSIAGDFDTSEVIQFGPSYPVQEVAPAFRLLRRFDHLDEGKAGTKLSEGAYPVGPVKDEVAVFVRGDYYGVALFIFDFDAFPQTGQTVFVMGFVEDKTTEVYKEKVFEGGDHVPGKRRDETAGTLGVSPAAAPQEIEQDETTEEEYRDDDEESYYAK
jgi:hypothetical protein